jgi:hypothetical protein
MRQRVARYIDQISAGDEHARAFLLLWAAVLRGASLHMIIRDAAPDSTARVREAVLASLAAEPGAMNGPQLIRKLLYRGHQQS